MRCLPENFPTMETITQYGKNQAAPFQNSPKLKVAGLRTWATSESYPLLQYIHFFPAQIILGKIKSRQIKLSQNICCCKKNKNSRRSETCYWHTRLTMGLPMMKTRSSGISCIRNQTNS